MPSPALPSAASHSTDELAVFESCEDVQEAWPLNGTFSSDSLYHDCHTQALNGDALPRERPHRVMEKEEEDEEQQDEVLEAEEAVERPHLPVVEASLTLDINAALTRQKISSVRHSRTLSYADHEDTEESPTRRRPAPGQLGSPDLHPSFVRTNSPRAIRVPASAHRTLRVSRNASYHIAVQDATVLKPRRSPEASPADQASSSCDTSPSRGRQEEQEEEGERRHTSVGDDEMLSPPAIIPRSISYSGQEALSSTETGRGSFSEGSSRSCSASQLSAAASHSAPPLTHLKPSPSFVRGSGLTRSFRRLFSSSTSSPTSPPAAEEWPDLPGLQHNTDANQKSSSRLRRIGSNLSRRLSTRSRMSAPSGANGQLVPNGGTTPEDTRSLVEYEDLLKLFLCSGCQSFMAPPLHQCRKGHLVCGACRLALKQVCPVCKQRFADNTNVMMEQVCQLVKFPCRYSGQGCPELHRPRAKVDHEHFCEFRPVHCHHASRGCPRVLLLRDMASHLPQCQYKEQ